MTSGEYVIVCGLCDDAFGDGKATLLLGERGVGFLLPVGIRTFSGALDPRGAPFSVADDGWRLKLTTFVHIMRKLRMQGAITHFP